MRLFCTEQVLVGAENTGESNIATAIDIATGKLMGKLPLKVPDTGAGSEIDGMGRCPASVRRHGRASET